MLEKPHFLCVLQTHSTSENQKGFTRYCGADKAEIMRRCVASLIASMNYAQNKLPWCEFKLVVLDDHSDLEAITALKQSLGIAVFETVFIPLESHGIMPSILACYELGLKEGKDMVYFAQDDYLFQEKSIEEMIQFYWHASSKLPKPISLYPFDDPYRYQDQNNFELIRIVHGRDRHWRTLYNCASCFMTHHSVIRENWDLFYKMGTSEVSPTMERDSINQLWQSRGYTLFCPVPSLALHMQYASEKDPFIDWRSWWNHFASEKTPKQYPFDKRKKLIVNMGSGKAPLDIPLIRRGEWEEIRVDTDPESVPDLLRPMHRVPELPPHSADAIWASHVLEHVSWHEIPSVMQEFKRILKEDGLLILSVPDLEEVAELILKKGLVDIAYDSPAGHIAPLDMLYGHRASIEAGISGMQHKTGFTAGVLKNTLSEFGFPYVICKRNNLEIRAFASNKPIDASNLDSVA